ncbi:MAG: hypothetical protein GWP14_03050 [Actinobacteria bacterium]|nr:hypothetical protein [Actinomycetota bacterium]
MVQFNCTSCKKKLVVPDKHIGKNSRCPQCKNTMIVPGAAKQNKESYVVAEDLGNKKYPAASSGRRAFDNASLWGGIGLKKYFIFACIVVTAVTCISVGIRYFRGAGDDSITDIRKVAADPEAYAGQTLRSRATMISRNHFAGEDGRYLALEPLPDLKSQADSIYQVVGNAHEVRITYRLYEWNTLAEIRDCQEIQKRVRGRSRRKMSLEKEQVRLEKPVRKFAAIEKQVLEVKAKLQRLTEEREQLAKELAQFRASEKNRLERISEIEVRSQQLSEEKKKLRKERRGLLASEEEDKLQRASEIKVKLQQLTEENKELTKEKDELQPEIKIEAELQRLASKETQLQRLVKNKKGQEQFNKDRARLAEEQARSLGQAASRVGVVSPSSSYSTVSRSTRRITSRSRSGGSRRSSSSAKRTGPSASELRAREEREEYAAQKKKRNKLLAQEKKQRRIALVATGTAGRLAKEQRELQQLIKGNAELQRTTIENLRVQQVMKEKQELQWSAKEKQQLQQLPKEEANLQRLTKQKERLQPLAKDNASRLAAIAEEIRKIEEADKNEEKIEFPVDSDGVVVNDLNCSGVLIDIDVPRYR